MDNLSNGFWKIKDTIEPLWRGKKGRKSKTPDKPKPEQMVEYSTIAETSAQKLMGRGEMMPQKSKGVLKSIAKQRSIAGKLRAKSSASTITGILDYVDVQTVIDDPHKPKKKKKQRWVCHPIVIAGLVTTIVYCTFMFFLIGYFHSPKIKEILDGLKRLANIKEWLRIIFKPWNNTIGRHGGANGGRSGDEETIPHVGWRLNPEFDVDVSK